jgi:type III pantothenate kinase
MLPSRMLLLFDIGNTHTHVGLASRSKVLRQTNIPTAGWAQGKWRLELQTFVRKNKITGISICSVVPSATPHILKAAAAYGKLPTTILTHKNVSGVGIKYPHPASIGADRLANAIAASHYYPSPVVVVAFGTAVAFDIIDRNKNYIGGIIAPGLSAMTDYLHEKTALLPRIKIREVKSVVGKSTEQAMLIGAVHGYRGLIRELIQELKLELKAPKLSVIATGGYATLMAKGMKEITEVSPSLTLEGLRLNWLGNQPAA